MLTAPSHAAISLRRMNRLLSTVVALLAAAVSTKSVW